MIRLVNNHGYTTFNIPLFQFIILFYFVCVPALRKRRVKTSENDESNDELVKAEDESN